MHIRSPWCRDSTLKFDHCVLYTRILLLFLLVSVGSARSDVGVDGICLVLQVVDAGTVKVFLRFIGKGLTLERQMLSLIKQELLHILVTLADDLKMAACNWLFSN